MSAFGSDKNTNGSRQVKLLKEEVAARLKYAGEARSFNASSLSKAANIPRSTMQKYWNGDRMLGSEYLYLIADILHVNPRWLITGEGMIDPAVEIDPGSASDEEQLLLAFRQLNTEMQQHVVEHAELLSKTAMPKLGDEQARTGTVHDGKVDFKPLEKE